MQLTILTPERSLFQGDVTSVKVPGAHGQFQVLNNHAPIVAALKSGAVEVITSSGTHEFFNVETGGIDTLKEAGKMLSFPIKIGFIEVVNNKISAPECVM